MISAIAAAPTADNVSGAHDDQQLVQTWIDAQGSSETRRAYAQIGTRFIVALAFEGLCLQALKLRDLQHYLS